MPESTAHPSQEQLSAYNLGQLPPDEAVAIETHISECEPCCDTIINLSSDDTFVGLLKEARQLPTDHTVDHGLVPASSSDQEVSPQLAAHPRYEILGLIGKGGMGDVFKARHRKMERTVALKVINRGLVQKVEAVDRFHREVKAAAQLSHPNIVTSHDADQAGDFHFLVMEFVDGVDLSRIVKDQGALPIAEACDYIRQVAIGLQHAHERGMVHRDIKPHNLMVTKDGTVKILDFGLASLAPESVLDPDMDEARGDLTAVGAIMGTPDFISPEQADDARAADIRSDIYSLGATLYFLLSAQPPFAEGSVMSKLKSHAQSDPKPLSTVRLDVPNDLAVVIKKMMAKDPAERFQTPEELAEALEPFTKSTKPQNIVEPQTQAERRRSKPTLLSPATVSVLFVAMVFAGLIYFIQTNQGGSHVALVPQGDRSTLGTHRLTIIDSSGKKPLGGTSGTRQNDATGVTTHFFESANGRYKVELDGKVLKVNGDKYTLENPSDEIRIVDDRVEITRVAVDPQDGEARQILDRMMDVYAECNSYRDSGVIKSLFFKNIVVPEFTVEYSFTTAFMRPERFRFEIKDEDAERLLIATNGQDVHSWWDVEPGVQKPDSLDALEFAMVQAVGFSGGDIGRVPGMLMPQRLDGWTDLELIDPRLIGDGTLQNVECFRLEYNFRDERVILWIDKQTYLVRQIDEQLQLDGMRVERTTTYDPNIDGKITDEMLEFDPPSPPATGDRANTLSEAADGDLGLLQGDWDVIAFTQDGKKELAVDKGVGMLVQIKGETITRIQMALNGEMSEKAWGRIELNSKTNPKSIDLVHPDGPGGRLLGIYEVKDSALMLCFAERTNVDDAQRRRVKRPTTFDAPVGSEMVLLECRRGTNTILSRELAESVGGESAVPHAPGKITRLSNATIYHLKDGVFIHEVFDGTDHYYLVNDLVESYELTPEGLKYVRQNAAGDMPRAPVGTIAAILREPDSRALFTRLKGDKATVRKILERFAADVTVDSVSNLTR